MKALGQVLKKGAAEFNTDFGLDPVVALAISQAAEEVISGSLWWPLPLVIWQKGANMNTNHDISNRAIEIFGRELGSNTPVYLNNHEKKSQLWHLPYPHVMHLLVAVKIHSILLPGINVKHNNYLDIITMILI